MMIWYYMLILPCSLCSPTLFKFRDSIKQVRHRDQPVCLSLPSPTADLHYLRQHTRCAIPQSASGAFQAFPYRLILLLPGWRDFVLNEGLPAFPTCHALPQSTLTSPSMSSTPYQPYSTSAFVGRPDNVGFPKPRPDLHYHLPVPKAA